MKILAAPSILASIMASCFACPALAQTDCIELARVLKEEYNVVSSHSIKRELVRMMAMSRDELHLLAEESKSSGGGGISYLSIGLDAAFEKQSSRQRLDQIRATLATRSESYLLDQEFLFLAKRTFDKRAYELLKACLEERRGERLAGMHSKFVEPNSQYPVMRMYYAKTPTGPSVVQLVDMAISPRVALQWDGPAPEFPLAIGNGGTELFRFRRVGSPEQGYAKATVVLAFKVLGGMDVSLRDIPAVAHSEALIRYWYPTDRWEKVDTVEDRGKTPDHDGDRRPGQPRSNDGEWRASDTKFEISALVGHRLTNVRIVHLGGPSGHHERQRISDGKWRWLVTSTHETRDIRFSADRRKAWIVIRAFTKPIEWQLKGDVERRVNVEVPDRVFHDGRTLRFKVPVEALDRPKPIVILSYGGSIVILTPGQNHERLEFQSKDRLGPNWQYTYRFVD